MLVGFVTQLCSPSNACVCGAWTHTVPTHCAYAKLTFHLQSSLHSGVVVLSWTHLLSADFILALGSLVPRPIRKIGEKGLVSTVCACT